MVACVRTKPYRGATNRSPFDKFYEIVREVNFGHMYFEVVVRNKFEFVALFCMGGGDARGLNRKRILRLFIGPILRNCPQTAFRTYSPLG